MSSKEHADRLARALESTGLCQAVKTNFGDNRISVMCRIAKDEDHSWIDLVTRMLFSASAEEGSRHEWQSHFCRNYFLKEDIATGTKKLVYGWNISIQSAVISKSLDCLIRVIKGEAPGAYSKSVEGEVMEMDLNASPNRGMNNNGKGAFTVGGPDDFRITPPTRRA